ncbi:MAG: LOG family protein [Gammaproteobacteria bacterium]|nr:LOG family protein [Gammaproteobacteria bacterium]MBT8151075.1 LOG family protein [Gammaproteobacteria bacterium]NND38337.1 LOG family protein [Pseudomonadales bacterium]NNM12327.1 LOG family protein [Pseudomonadales bacterium]RZV60165.1 MAG: LOG family protein [Pseudomonadales bacterium]
MSVPSIAKRNGATVVSTSVTPASSLQILSHREVEQLYDASQTELYSIFRQCSLAVINCGSAEDDTSKVLEEYADFDISIIQRERGIKLEIVNAPAKAFVDGEMIQGIREHLFAVLRDIVFVQNELYANPHYDLSTSQGTTDAIFNIMRNADALIAEKEPNLVVCWGGHSIGREEYDYTKKVGYELGLRGLDICTGCGPGAMKGPMKGAAVAHRKQRNSRGRYLGITEPGIIAAESPNPVVNELVIMPDIEKRLEAFVRVGHGILVFPGGVGTAEEIFYLLGLLLHEDNRGKRIPLIFTAPIESADYFTSIDEFIGLTLGPEAQSMYEIIIGGAEEVAKRMSSGMQDVRRIRREAKDAYYFNWSLVVPRQMQSPFVASHQSMAALRLEAGDSKFDTAVNMRAMFSGIVAGNVKAEGIADIAAHGNYQISGDARFMQAIDALLQSFVAQGRMKINASAYQPCYDIVTS